MNDKVSEREFEAVIRRVDGRFDSLEENMNVKLDTLSTNMTNMIESQNNLIDASNNAVNKQIRIETDQNHLEQQQEETNATVIELVKSYKPSWDSYKKVQKNASVISVAAAVTLAGLITGSIYTLVTDKPPPEPKAETKKVQLVKK